MSAPIRFALSFAATLAAASAVPSAADIPFTKITIDAASPPDPWMKTAGDFTGDGFADVVVCGSKGPLILYAYPDWKKTQLASSASSESGSAAADIDGDGDLDLVIGTDWYVNPGPGKTAAGPWESHSLGLGGTHDVAVADLDLDGKIDVIMRGESTHDVILFKQVSPTAWTKKTLPAPVGYNGLALADLDKDGDPDIIIPGAWLENPRGDFAAAEWPLHPFASWDQFGAIQTGDFNADGFPDIVMSYSESAGRVSWFQGSANPKAADWKEHPIDAGPVTNAHALEVADIDRDGDADVITSEYEGAGRLLIYANSGKGADWGRQVVGTSKLHNIRVADFGKDGDLDILGAYAWGVNPVELWRNDLPGAAIRPFFRPSRAIAGGVRWQMQGRELAVRVPAALFIVRREMR